MQRTPESEAEIWEMLNAAWPRMNPRQQRVWESISVLPQKWQLHPWADPIGGFWVVGVIGPRVIWYNEYEEGFNLSRYSKFGTIDEYWCNQDELEWTIQGILNEFDGLGRAPRTGPPQPGAFGAPLGEDS